MLVCSAAAHKHQALKRAKLPPAPRQHHSNTNANPAAFPGRPQLPGMPKPTRSRSLAKTPPLPLVATTASAAGATAANSTLNSDDPSSSNGVVGVPDTDTGNTNTPIPPWVPGWPPLTITGSDEPADILFENLGIPLASHLCIFFASSLSA